LAVLVFSSALSVADVPVLGAGDPYAADPLRLVPFADTVQRAYTQGTDTWEVWICDIPDWSTPLSLPAVVTGLNNTISPYYEWLSDGAYRPTFVPGGSVQGTDVIPPEPNGREDFRAPDCESQVQTASTGPSNGAMIVLDGGFDGGYATAGAVCPEDPYVGCLTAFPDNFRIAVVGAAGVTTVAPFAEPQWITPAHEIGHALNWTHSYGGLTTLPGSTTINQYDNPMDLMSGDVHEGLPIGTIAYYRYSAGWIDPQDVVIHRGATATYELGAVGAGGTQLLVVPIDAEQHFYAIGARRRVSFDADLPKAGVEVYEIDQRRSVCTLPDTWPDTWPCFATFIRVAQNPAEKGITGTSHVLSIDEELTLGLITIRVVAAATDSFAVQVTDARAGFRFIDDDGNEHEANIEAIAAAEITTGCNPPIYDRYCPLDEVNRAQMAAFLIRSLDEEANLPPYQGYFPDVLPDAWYRPYVERLFELQITTGFPQDGTFRPLDVVNRAQMAVFLIRAFEYADQVGVPAGVFADVDPGAWYAGETELLYQLGITTGCSNDPLEYCPSNPVKRDQMASFLARTLGIASP
jgi:hypothetical protein